MFFLILTLMISKNFSGMFLEFISSKLKPTEKQIGRVRYYLDDSYELCQISALRLLSTPFFEISNFVSIVYFLEKFSENQFSIVYFRLTHSDIKLTCTIRRSSIACRLYLVNCKIFFVFHTESSSVSCQLKLISIAKTFFQKN